MSDRFSSLVRAYTDQLLQLTGRIYRCSPVSFLFGVPVFLVNQVSFVLAFLLPLKVIIMLGSDGVPRYFRFFMTEETRSAWMVGLAGGALGFFVLYFVSGEVLRRLGERASKQVLRSSRKAGLFDDQERFAGDVFSRVVGTWGTVAMATGGALLGLLLEWRLVVLLIAAIVLEFIFFAIYWNRFSEPEQAGERERLVEQRTTVLQNLSGLNVLILFVGLVVLLLTDPDMNFIVAVVLFLLTRQVLSRSVRMFADANFFMRNQERIDALVHPERHLRETRSSERDSFERLLMPDRRGRLFNAVAAAANLDFSNRDWAWRDLSGKGAALFVSESSEDDESEYRLKVTMRAGDAGLAREKLFYESDSATALGLSCEMLHAGSVFGRGCLLLRSTALQPCPRRRFSEMAFRIRMRLWQHHPDQDLVSRLLRSFPPLDARLTPDRISRIRLACTDETDERKLARFLEQRGRMVEALQRLPRVLTAATLSPPNVYLTESDEPILLNWESLRWDVVGSDLIPQDLRRAYSPENVQAEPGSSAGLQETLPDWGLRLVVHLAHVDRQIHQENYAEALSSIDRVLQIMEGIDHEAIERPRASISPRGA